MTGDYSEANLLRVSGAMKALIVDYIHWLLHDPLYVADELADYAAQGE